MIFLFWLLITFDWRELEINFWNKRDLKFNGEFNNVYVFVEGGFVVDLLKK